MLTSVGDVRLNVHDRGAGPAVVFLHGIGCRIDTWAPQLETLASRHRTVALDTRGFGDSDGPTGDMSMTDYAADVLGVLDALGIDDTVLVGLSMGGMIAQHVALTAPTRIRALVLADTTGRSGPTVSETLDASAAAALEYGMQPLVEGFLAGSFAPAAFTADPDSVDVLRRSLLATDPRAFAVAGRAIVGHDTLNALGGLDIPTTVVVGEHDALLPREHSEALADAIPNSKLVVIPDAGHMSNLEQPSRFDAALATALSH